MMSLDPSILAQIRAYEATTGLTMEAEAWEAETIAAAEKNAWQTLDELLHPISVNIITGETVKSEAYKETEKAFADIAEIMHPISVSAITGEVTYPTRPLPTIFGELGPGVGGLPELQLFQWPSFEFQFPSITFPGITWPEIDWGKIALYGGLGLIGLIALGYAWRR